MITQHVRNLKSNKTEEIGHLHFISSVISRQVYEDVSRYIQKNQHISIISFEEASRSCQY